MKNGQKTAKVNKGAFNALALLIVIGSFLGFLVFAFPTAFLVVVNFLWIFLVLVVVVFLVLGMLVVFGLRREVSKFLDIVLEGSLSIIDAIDLIKKIYNKFTALLIEFLFFIAPVLAISCSIFLYLILIYLYKSVGIKYNVTALTILITVLMMVLIALLNNPTENKLSADVWTKQWAIRFKRFFADSFEIVIFVFFLTMDSTNLFFMPEGLNIPLRASLGNFNLMYKGANVRHQLNVTILLVTVAIVIEIIRNIIKIVAGAISYFNQNVSVKNKTEIIKGSIRGSFADAKDDIVKFITFTTVLITVFLLFPRLKLFAMVVASTTGLALDILIPTRIHAKQSKDLISRIIVKAFRL